MARLSDLSLRNRLYMATYRYRRAEWAPGAVLRRPLSEARVAVITTAGFYLPGQDPFDEEMKGGDFSWRPIPLDADLRQARLGHRSDAFDPGGIERDPELALPVHRLLELAADGVIGSVAPTHYSFQGSVSAPGRLVRYSAPEVAQALHSEEVDLALLTPV